MDNYVVFFNFFSPSVFKFICHNSREATLNLTALGDQKYYGTYNSEQLDSIKTNVYQSKSEFKYYFFRSETHDLATTRIKMVMENPKVLNVLSEKVGIPLTKVNICFVSYYNTGCFLDEHYDGCKGKYAFMLYLNDLDKEDGGSLVIDHDTIITPQRNCLVLLKTNVLHKVLPMLQKERWTFTGWFA